MNHFDLIVIGGSAGSFQGLLGILPVLRADIPSPPVAVALHLRPDRPSGICEFFAQKCGVEICEAEDKEDIQAATVYFAPPNYHLLVSREGWLSLSIDPPVNYSRPSIDVLFESAAAYAGGVLAILLSGANEDGAAGMAAIESAGGTVIVQDPDTATSPEMPSSALKACRAARSMQIEEIAEFVSHCAAPRRSGKAMGRTES